MVNVEPTNAYYVKIQRRVEVLRLQWNHCTALECIISEQGYSQLKDEI